MFSSVGCRRRKLNIGDDERVKVVTCVVGEENKVLPCGTCVSIFRLAVATDIDSFEISWRCSNARLERHLWSQREASGWSRCGQQRRIERNLCMATSQALHPSRHVRRFLLAGTCRAHILEHEIHVCVRPNCGEWTI